MRAHKRNRRLTRGAQRTIGDKFSPLPEPPSVARYTDKLIKHRARPTFTHGTSASMIRRRSADASVPAESTSSRSKERECKCDQLQIGPSNRTGEPREPSRATLSRRKRDDGRGEAALRRSRAFRERLIVRRARVSLSCDLESFFPIRCDTTMGYTSARGDNRPAAIKRPRGKAQLSEGG